MTAAPRQRTHSGHRLQTAATVTIAVLATLGALFVGRELLIPIALALFFNTLLSPIIRRMSGMGMPAPLASAVLLLVLIGAVTGSTMLLWPQARGWLVKAPDSLHAAQQRLETLWQPLQQVSDAAADLGKGATPSGGPDKPVVAVATPQPRVLASLGTTATVVAGAVEVVLLLYLLLASGGVFLERLVGILPTRADKRTAVSIFTAVEKAVAQYLIATAIINVGEATLVGLAMWGLGMPAPLLWGALTLALEFVPYLGAAVLVAALSVSAVATFDTLGRAAMMPAAYLLISTLQNNVASPLLYGNRLKLNAVAVLVSVLFWWYLWGVAGAFLAVPLLATGKILCDHIESLGSLGKFLEA